MNNIYDVYPRYCLACENKEICWENHWAITMDKDGKRCDNFKVRKDIKELMEYEQKE